MAGSKLLELIKIQAGKSMSKGFELATVTNTSPLSIKIDNMGLELDKSFLICSESLLERESNITVAMSSTSVGEHGNHAHEIIDETAIFHSRLSIGDRVVVCEMLGGTKYLIIDKVVEDL